MLRICVVAQNSFIESLVVFVVVVVCICVSYCFSVDIESNGYTLTWNKH